MLLKHLQGIKLFSIASDTWNKGNENVVHLPLLLTSSENKICLLHAYENDSQTSEATATHMSGIFNDSDL